MRVQLHPLQGNLTRDRKGFGGNRPIRPDRTRTERAMTTNYNVSTAADLGADVKAIDRASQGPGGGTGTATPTR